MSIITRKRNGIVNAKFNKKYLTIEEIEIVKYGIAAYSFLLPIGKTKMTDFAQLMVGYSSNEKTKQIRDIITKSDVHIYGCVVTHLINGEITETKCTVRASNFEEAKKHLKTIFKDAKHITHTYLRNIFVTGTLTTYCATR